MLIFAKVDVDMINGAHQMFLDLCFPIGLHFPSILKLAVA